MRRVLPGGYELDDDKRRVDLAAVHRFLSTQSYWAVGCKREDVERGLLQATRAVALYAADGALAGYARVLTDGRPGPYLADVFVLREHRGRGLGVELVRECVEREPLASQAWELRTNDAHGLYERFGFHRLNQTQMARPARVPARPVHTPV